MKIINELIMKTSGLLKGIFLEVLRLLRIQPMQQTTF
jgi:putative component of membrane protein insertase Oxa1/YidC/SpoIIIJ protein YidD